MKNKERFLKVMNYEEVDRVPLSLAGPWGDTLKRWHKEGLPENIDVHKYLGVYDYGVKLKYMGKETFKIECYNLYFLLL